MKLIGRTFHVDGSGPWTLELYDLASDPAERRDLSAARPVELKALWARLQGALE
jgi:hypothetical protein